MGAKRPLPIADLCGGYLRSPDALPPQANPEVDFAGATPRDAGPYAVPTAEPATRPRGKARCPRSVNGRGGSGRQAGQPCSRSGQTFLTGGRWDDQRTPACGSSDALRWSCGIVPLRARSSELQTDPIPFPSARPFTFSLARAVLYALLVEVHPPGGRPHRQCVPSPALLAEKFGSRTGIGAGSSTTP